MISFRVQCASIAITLSFFLYALCHFNNRFFSLDLGPKQSGGQQRNNEQVSLAVKDIIESDWNRNKHTLGISITRTTALEKNRKAATDEQNNEEIEKIKSLTLSKGRILSLQQIETYEQGEARITTCYAIIEVFGKSDYHLFPFDDHILQLHFRGKKSIFSESPSLKGILKKEHDFAGWSAKKIETEVNDDGSWYDLRWFIFLNKSGYRTAIALLFPLLILFFIALLSLSIPPSDISKFILTILLGINSFRLVIETSAPKVASLMAIDIFYVIFFLITFFLFMIHTAEIPLTRFYEYLIMIIAHGSIIVSSILLIIYWK